MRFLLDTYIQASASQVVSDFEDTGLVHLIVKLGSGAIDKLPAGIKKDPDAVAETIANNIRKVIIDERAMNPAYYDKMSDLLDAIIEARRKHALDYQEYLAQLLDTAKKIGTKESDHPYSDWADNGAKRALIDFFFPDEHLAIEVDTIVRHTKPDSWVGNPMKERLVRNAIKRTLPDNFDRLGDLFELVKARDEYR